MTIGFTAQAAKTLTEANAKKIDVTEELTYIFNQISQASFKGLCAVHVTIDNYNAILTSPKTEKIVRYLKDLEYKIPFLRCGPTLDMKVSWNED